MKSLPGVNCKQYMLYLGWPDLFKAIAPPFSHVAFVVATTIPGYAARSQSRAGLTVGTWPISMLACGVADVCVRRNVWSVAYAVKHGSAKVIHGRAVRPGVCDGAEACLPRTVDLSAVFLFPRRSGISRKRAS